MAADTLTITLTDRRPVTIRKEDWPVIASAHDDSWRGNDVGRYQQALAQGECDTYRLTVRQHADGRAIVYGVLDAAIAAWHQPAHGESWRGGELLGMARPAANDAQGWDRYRAAGGETQVSSEALVAAIRRVGESGGLPESIIRACIADLPAETLT